MVIDPDNMSKEEQFQAVAQILATALIRWHRENKGKLRGATRTPEKNVPNPSNQTTGDGGARKKSSRRER